MHVVLDIRGKEINYKFKKKDKSENHFQIYDGK